MVWSCSVLVDERRQSVIRTDCLVPLDSNLIDCAKLIDRAIGSSLLVVALTVGRQEPDVLNRSTEL